MRRIAVLPALSSGNGGLYIWDFQKRPQRATLLGPQMVTRELKIRRRRRLRKRDLLAALNFMKIIVSRLILQMLAIFFEVEF